MIVLSLSAFFFTSVVHVLAIAIKTQWFRYLPGWILAAYVGGFVVTGMYLLGRWAGWLPVEWQLPFYIGVFGVYALVNVVSTIVLLNRNWNYWAWSK